MKHKRITSGLRKAVNLSLDKDVVADARTLGINLSQTCERALQAAVKNEREEAWVRENRDAIQSFNDYVEKNGIPLSQYRQF